MRKIREVLRLRFERGLNTQAIARACSMGKTTVIEYLERARKAGINWPVDLDDEQLEGMLFSCPASDPERPVPDWSKVHKELKGKGVTLSLLWQEYKANNPRGYQYTQFCDLYRRWIGSADPVMRQSHRAGEKLFVDYAGQTIAITDAESGGVRQAQVFIAVLGASNYTYAEATWTQGLSDWIGSHVRALEFFSGVPEVVVPDNLKSGVTSPCRYEPELNPTYREWAAHYSVSVVPARVRKPRDKAKVENGVLQAERSILAPLRHRTFFDLAEANAAIAEKLRELNERPFQKLEGSRASAFEQIDRAALRPLPAQRYEYAEWRKATAGVDYHVEVDGHYYSVPYRLAQQRIDLRLTRRGVECFHKGVRVSSHIREEKKGGATTVRSHMPPSHQSYMDWTPERVMGAAERIGADVVSLVKILLERPHLGLRSSLGVLRLAKEYGEERLCAACRRAMAIDAVSFRSLQSILATGLDRTPLADAPHEGPALHHGNLRGPHYYN